MFKTDQSQRESHHPFPQVHTLVISRIHSHVDILLNKYKNNWIKLKDEVGMAVPKSTQTRFVGITYHIHYTSLRLLFSSTSDSIKCRCILILIHGYAVLIFHSCKHAPHIICVCTATQKASVGMYSGCDTLSLRILFVYFLALPSLLHPSILFNCFLYLLLYILLKNLTWCWLYTPWLTWTRWRVRCRDLLNFSNQQESYSWYTAATTAHCIKSARCSFTTNPESHLLYQKITSFLYSRRWRASAILRWIVMPSLTCRSSPVTRQRWGEF